MLYNPLKLDFITNIGKPERPEHSRIPKYTV
jgi:hypothetical protein